MKLPKNAKRVYKGEIFDVYQWQQKMFDGSFKVFEGIKRQSTVVIIPIVKNKIVIIKQKQPRTDWFFSFPSGRMDVKGESPKKAALRELLEETGLRPKSIHLWKTINSSGKIDHPVYIFIAKDCEKTASQKLDIGEKIQIFDVTFDAFLKLSDKPNFMVGPMLIDILQARLHLKYKNYLKRVFFSNLSSLPKSARLAKSR